MGIFIGDREVQSLSRMHPTRLVQQRPTSVWVGDRRIWPPLGRELILEFTTGSWPQEHVSDVFTSGAMARYDVRVPWWAVFVDFVIIGGGNGGNGGSGSVSWNHGTGGSSAPWVSGSGPVDLPATARVTVGTGGDGAASRETTGGRGNASLLNFVAVASASRAPSQPSGYGDHWGQSPGNHTAFDRTFTGGSGGDRGNPGYPGSAPGAGGGGGNGGTFTNGRPGGRGGDGYAWIRFRSD